MYVHYINEPVASCVDASKRTFLKLLCEIHNRKSKILAYFKNIYYICNVKQKRKEVKRKTEKIEKY